MMLHRASYALLLIVTGCTDAPVSDDVAAQIDPAVALALSDQLMVDPDLVGQNEAAAALTVNADQSVPLEITTPEAIADAQQRAAEFLRGLGGPAELPRPGQLPDTNTPLALLVDEIARLPDAAECLPQARQSAIWAARVPAMLPIYPRGATQDAWGSDAPRCALRAVRFTSPVAAEDIARFYFTAARAAGLRPRYRAADGEHRIDGGKGKTRFAVHVRPHFSGGREIDLVVITG